MHNSFYRRVLLGITAAIFISGLGHAEERRRDDDAKRRNDDSVRRDDRHVSPRPHDSRPVARPDYKPSPSNHYRSPYWVLDGRYRHNHYYPVPGYTVTTLPAGHISVLHGNNRFYYHAGVWFRPQGTRYIVAAPPIGVVVPSLPPDYSTVWIDSKPYYYANGQYYASAPDSGYTIVQAPTESAAASNIVETRPAVPDLQVIPRNGQSQSQVFMDRAECARLAREQTGVDPLVHSGDDDHSQNALNRYRRTEALCLQDRGYSVR